ncbi:MAG: alpha/beta hydrolase [Chloroflexi bacterium]|nr:alpha/beta hydrolase [Chloroflexota bacterium]
MATNRREYELLKEARDRLLRKYAPGTTEKRVRWSGGGTQALEIGDGPALLFVHGGLGQASDWAPIMARLSREFHVYAVDRPGHGLADSFDYRGVDILSHAVVFLKGILDELGLRRVPVVGNSMGGRWAIELALREPDRVSHVILTGLPAGAARELPREFYEVPKLLRLIQRPVIGPFVRNMMAKPSSREHARKGIAGMVSHAERISDEILDAGTFNFIRNRRSMLSLVEQGTDKVGMVPEFVMTDKWRIVKVPTTFLWGEKDVFGSPQLGREAASKMPKGKFVLIPEAGHLPWLDEPEKVAEEIAKAIHIM